MKVGLCKATMLSFEFHRASGKWRGWAKTWLSNLSFKFAADTTPELEEQENGVID